jgi:hypothetical protein
VIRSEPKEKRGRTTRKRIKKKKKRKNNKKRGGVVSLRGSYLTLMTLLINYSVSEGDLRSPFGRRVHFQEDSLIFRLDEKHRNLKKKKKLIIIIINKGTRRKENQERGR